jgi:paraquat-inducible protein B
MAKQTNKTVIGIFVISAIAMLIAGVIVIGGGQMFKKTVKYVMFFDRSVKGLSVGAPVVWSGVKVGSVSSVEVDFDADKFKIDIPVVIELDPSLINIKGKQAKNIQERGRVMSRLIELGLRARLTLQSLVTGQLMIALGFHPDKPAHLTGIKSEYLEVPTITAAMSEFTDKLEKLPVDKIAKKLHDVLNNIDTLVSGPEIKKILHNVATASKNLDRLILSTDDLVTNTDGRVEKVSDSLLATLGDSRKFMDDTSSDIQPVSVKLQEALVSTRLAMDQAKTALVSVNDFVGKRSKTRLKLDRTLDELGTAARSLNSLMNYLERHPEALVHGKKGGGG